MNESQTYRLLFDPRAWREIMALSLDVQYRIFEALENLEKTPRPAGCKKLKDASGLYRIRVGNYRVVYDIQDAALVIIIVRIGDRKNVYD